MNNISAIILASARSSGWAEGIVGDDTDGHIDDLARFLNPTTIATVVEEDPADANYPILQENLERLRHMRDPDGKSFRIVELPMPGLVEYEGQRLPASYANFYIANGMVLVPTFGDKNDRVALEILQREFRDRRVIGLDSTELIWGLGSFHCITQQEPGGLIQIAARTARTAAVNAATRAGSGNPKALPSCSSCRVLWVIKYSASGHCGRSAGLRRGRITPFWAGQSSITGDESIGQTLATASRIFSANEGRLSGFNS